MTKYIRRAAALCAVLFVALLVNAARVQIVRGGSYDDNPANRYLLSQWLRRAGHRVIG